MTLKCQPFAMGFALGRGCTTDEACTFAIYASDQPGTVRIADLFEDWYSTRYVSRQVRGGPWSAEVI